MRGVIIDRDGVIAQERGGHIAEIHEFSWVNGAKELLCHLSEKGYQVFLITEQPGVGKGIFKMDKVMALHHFIQKELNQLGGVINSFLVCPHHKKKTKCLCRRPETLHLERIMAMYRLRPSDLVLISDNPRDIKAAERVSLTSFLISTNQIPSELSNQIDEHFESR